MKPSICPILLAVAALALGGLPVRAQDGGAIRVLPWHEARPDERADVRWALAKRLPEAPEIDGVPDEALWEQAGALDGFSYEGPQDKVRLWAAVGHADGHLFVAGRAEGEVGPDDRFVVLFDSWGDRESAQTMAVRADGARSFRAWAEGRPASWRPGADVATHAEDGAWAFEARFPRTDFADPDNDALGFNLLYMGAVRAAWNPPAAPVEAIPPLGRLAYEHRPLTVIEARVGVLGRGENRLALRVANSSAGRLGARVLINVEDDRGRSVQRRYRFDARPAGNTDVAMWFPLPGDGPYTLGIFLLDEELRRHTALYRRNIRPAETLKAEVAEQDADGLTLRLDWPIPPPRREALELIATLMRASAGEVLARAQMDAEEHPGAEVRVVARDLDKGEYRVRLILSRRGLVLRSRTVNLRVGEEGLEEAGVE